jgi:hypothetical protein
MDTGVDVDTDVGVNLLVAPDPPAYPNVSTLFQAQKVQGTPPEPQYSCAFWGDLFPC